MKQPLKGPHHFTGITRDVTANVDFWCRVMGLRFVKNTLNFETTFRYHTYFGDEEGNPGSVVTFLEFTEAKPGVPGDGDIQRLVLRGRSYDSLEYWMDRLIANQTHSEMLRLDPTQPQSLVFWDPENHEVELMVSDAQDPPLVAGADDIPAEHRILGLEGARSFTTLEEQLPFAEHVGFRRDGTRLVLDGERAGRWDFSEPPGPSPTPRAAPAAAAASASGTTSPSMPAPARRCSEPATRRTRACGRGRRSSTTTSSTAATRCLPEGGWRSARRGLGFSSTRSSRTSATASASRLEWSRFAPSSSGS